MLLIFLEATVKHMSTRDLGGMMMEEEGSQSPNTKICDYLASAVSIVDPPSVVLRQVRIEGLTRQRMEQQGHLAPG